VGAPRCPLCEWEDAAIHYLDGRRPYLRCPRCDLIFVPAEAHLSPEEERAEYDLHQNDPADPGYRRFLARLLVPLRVVRPPPARVLDFGCGPGPALASLLTEAGYAVECFDPFYAPDETVFQRRYQVITATEVVEHLAAPGQELRRLWALLEPGGVLAIMTQRATEAWRFPSWHYVRDPTHVAFFSAASFRWLADHLGARLSLPLADVALLQRQ